MLSNLGFELTRGSTCGGMQKPAQPLAAIFKAMVTLLLVGSRPFPLILSPLMRLSGHRRNQETKWSSVSPLLLRNSFVLVRLRPVLRRLGIRAFRLWP